MRAYWNSQQEGLEMPDGYADYLSWWTAVEEAGRGIALDQISTRWSDPLHAEQERFMFAGGFSKLLDKMAIGLDLRLSQKARIIQERDGRVSVLSLDETFEGDFLVITLPLGVLRAGDLRIEPEPSHAKKTAIQKLGIGEANKVILRYDKVSWPRDKPFIGLVDGDKSGYPQLINMAFYNGRPILVAQIGRAQSLAIAQRPDAEVAAELQALLKQRFKNLPEPVEYKVTHWASEKFSKGAYSYLPTGADVEMRDFLARPEGRIYYAGEATMRQGAGTIKGAYLSGIRAAEWIMEK
jgi:polyamine oxidase